MAKKDDYIKTEVDGHDLKKAGFDDYLNRTDYGKVDDILGGTRRTVSVSNLATGQLGGETVMELGSDAIKVDGQNRRITIHDGVDTRVLIGFQQDGF
jgi:hypothetical protein